MNVKRIYSNTWKTLIWPVAIYLIFFIMTNVMNTGSKFGDLGSMDTIVKQTMICALIALAMSCNMLNGRWDFSMGIICVVTSFIAASIIKDYGLNSWGLLVVSIIICTVLCLINGILYILIKVPSIVISIGMLLVYESLSLIINKGGGARLSGMTYTVFGRSPHIYILSLVMFIIFYVIYTHTRFGYNVRSLGNNQIIANNIGVNEKKNTILSYVLCGVFLGVAACINVSTKGNIEASSTFNNNMGMMFTAFPPVFIGLYLSKYINYTVGVFYWCIMYKNADRWYIGLRATICSTGYRSWILPVPIYSTYNKPDKIFRLEIKAT